MTSPDPKPQPTLPEPGSRRRLPATRTGVTHKFSIAGFEGYLTANTYQDGSLGELFINDIGKEGSTLRGVLAMFAMATSVAFQYGTPPEVLGSKLALMNFEPKRPPLTRKATARPGRRAPWKRFQSAQPHDEGDERRHHE